MVAFSSHSGFGDGNLGFCHYSRILPDSNMRQKVVIITGCSAGGIGAHLYVSALCTTGHNTDPSRSVDASSWQNAVAGKSMRQHGTLER